MTVIKHNDARRVLGSAVALDLGDWDQRAKAVIDAAKAEAERIVDEGQRAAAEAAEAARVAAQEEGRRAGRADADAAVDRAAEAVRPELEALADAWSAELERWEQHRQQQLLDLGEDVVRFSLQLAGKIVHRVIDVDPNVVLDQVAEALELVAGSTAVELAVNPKDRTLLERALPNLVERVGGCRQVAFRDDDTVARGGCAVITTAGAVDATIETQLQRIAEALIGDPRTAPDEPPVEGRSDVQ